MEYKSQALVQDFSPHRKIPSPFSIAGILGLDQATPSDPSSLVTPSWSPRTFPVAPSWSPAIHPVTPSTIPAKYPAQQLPRVPRRRRRPTVYTAEQIEALESVFAANQYPDINSREVLSDALEMSEARVQVWFQNRRARHRRQSKRKASPSLSSSDQASSSPLSSSPDGSEPTLQTKSPSESPDETTAIISRHLSPDTTSMTSSQQQQRCAPPCCSSPPISTPASCSNDYASSSKTLPRYGPQQQSYGGAFAYAYYPHHQSRDQYAYYYRPSSYTTVSSVYQGTPIASVPTFPPVARVEPVTNAVDY